MTRFNEPDSWAWCNHLIAREAPPLLRQAMNRDPVTLAELRRFLGVMVAFDRSMAEQGIDQQIRADVLTGVVRREMANLERANQSADLCDVPLSLLLPPNPL